MGRKLLGVLDDHSRRTSLVHGQKIHYKNDTILGVIIVIFVVENLQFTNYRNIMLHQINFRESYTTSCIIFDNIIPYNEYIVNELPLTIS